MSATNPGLDIPIPKCGARCGGPQQAMEAFDQLPRSLRDFFNDEACVSWCMCGALWNCTLFGEAKTLERYRELERQYR
jgi:hypothetical protein